MGKDKVLGVIITYNPDLTVLKNNLKHVIPQVDGLLVYDNASDNMKEIMDICRGRDNKNTYLPPKLWDISTITQEYFICQSA